MKRYALTVLLKDDPALIEKYMTYHRAVWPQVERGLKSVGIMRFDIYATGRQLLMMMETVDEFDPQFDFDRYMATDPLCRQWEAETDECMEGMENGQAGQWLELAHIYSLV